MLQLACLRGEAEAHDERAPTVRDVAALAEGAGEDLRLASVQTTNRDCRTAGRRRLYIVTLDNTGERKPSRQLTADVWFRMNTKAK